MSEAIDETDNVYGKLYVVSRAENSPDGAATWLCRCDCGQWKEAKGGDLRTGQVRSCGCLRRERSDRKLTPDEVYAIRVHCRAYGHGSQARMVKKFNVSRQTVTRILQGTIYEDVPEDDLSLNAPYYREVIEALNEYEATYCETVLRSIQ